MSAPSWTLLPGDMREILASWKGLLEVDSVVCDPPYDLVSVVKRFGGDNAAPAKSNGPTGVYARASAGFMGKRWDGTGIAFDPATWRAVYDCMKPGAHLLAFGGNRTVHRMTCAIEDAGFEIRDCIMWMYGTGFPKSRDVSKGIDKNLGAKGSFGAPKSAAHAGWTERGRMRGEDGHAGYQRPWMDDPAAVDNAARQYLPGSPEAAAWEGWGTALKPAYEPVIVARKPLDGTVAENVLAHGCGGLNIDGCRVGTDITTTMRRGNSGGNGAYGRDERVFSRENPPGRWPANVIHDGSDEVLAAFAAYGESKSSDRPRNNGAFKSVAKGRDMPHTAHGHSDSGTAARFFYSAKASAADRAGSKHPTVKPQALMRYLCRLVTPPGGTVLDPFCGSGSTLQAALAEGFSAIGIEQETEYQADIRRRMAAVQDSQKAA